MTEGAPMLLEMRLLAAQAFPARGSRRGAAERRAYEVPACGKARRAGVKALVSAAMEAL